jgi:hypothetical protein
MVINPTFDFGEPVWHKAGLSDDDYKMKGLVVGYEVLPGMLLRYDVRWADNSIGTHYECELTNTPFQEGIEELN